MSTYPDGRASSGEGRSPSSRRSADACTCSACLAVAGGLDPHNASTSVSVGTTSPALAASAASSVRSSRLPIAVDEPSWCPSSTGPSSRTSVNGDAASCPMGSIYLVLSEP
jgi:hypothetical protein